MLVFLHYSTFSEIFKENMKRQGAKCPLPVTVCAYFSLAWVFSMKRSFMMRQRWWLPSPISSAPA